MTVMIAAFKFFRQYQAWITLAVIVGAILYSFGHRLVRPTAQPSASPSVSVTATTAAVLPSHSPDSTVTASTAPQPTTSTVSSTGTQQLIESQVMLADLDSTNRLIYFLEPNSRTLYTYNLTDGTTAVAGQMPNGTAQAVWSPDHRRLIVRITDNNDQSRLSVYDIETKQLKPLDSHITTASFLGNNHIIYHYRNGFLNNLSISLPDGSNWQNIGSGAENTTIGWTGNTALIQEQAKSSITQYNESGQKISSLTIPTDLSLATSVWSADGKNAIYWTLDKGQMTVKLFATGHDPSVITTLADKEADSAILWDNNTGELYLTGLNGLTKLDKKVSLP